MKHVASIGRFIAFALLLLVVHFLMWTAVPWILDGPVLPSDTYAQRLFNLAVMGVWLWVLPIASIILYERLYLRRRDGRLPNRSRPSLMQRLSSCSSQPSRWS
jgi:hypothetical protein